MVAVISSYFRRFTYNIGIAKVRSLVQRQRFRAMTSLESGGDENIRRAAKAVKEAKCIVITAGAGMGVDSGLPDFRGPEGLWKAYPPLKDRGLTLPETSTPHWFSDDPKFAWGFFGHRYNLYSKTKPHRGFQILRKWSAIKPGGYFVFTSNVDGHFQKAGFSVDKVVECHGSINYLQCVDHTYSGEIWPFPGDFSINIDDSLMEAKNKLPMGPPDLPSDQQRLARPNIKMFGDWNFIGDRTYEQMDRFQSFQDGNICSNANFVVVEIGAGLAVPTVRITGEQLVRRSQEATLIRINPRDPEIPNKRHISLSMGGLEALERIDSLIESSTT